MPFRCPIFIVAQSSAHATKVGRAQKHLNCLLTRPVTDTKAPVYSRSTASRQPSWIRQHGPAPRIKGRCRPEVLRTYSDSAARTRHERLVHPARAPDSRAGAWVRRIPRRRMCVRIPLRRLWRGGAHARAHGRPSRCPTGRRGARTCGAASPRPGVVGRQEHHVPQPEGVACVSSGLSSCAYVSPSLQSSMSTGLRSLKSAGTWAPAGPASCRSATRLERRGRFVPFISPGSGLYVNIPPTAVLLVLPTGPTGKHRRSHLLVRSYVHFACF
jgi:hypothetical protein